MQTQYDILIVGAGLVGLSLALALANTDLQIGIVDNRLPQDQFNLAEFDLRVSAINRASQNFFTALNFWQLLPRKSVYKKMQVWDASTRAEINFCCREIALPDLGHIVENSALQHALLQQLAPHKNIKLIAPVTLSKFSTQATRQQLHLSDNQILAANLIVGADGANSWLRQQAKIELYEKNYAQHALVATLQTQLPHQATAYQIFLPTGPLAFLPLAEPNTCSIVWSTTPQQAEALAQKDATEFATTLSHAFEHRLGTVNLISKRLLFPLKTQHVKQYVLPGLALVGDAAHTVHPFAGQGLNIGLADVAALANLIKQALAKKQDYASISTLRKYERRCQAENKTRLLALDKLHKLFDSSSKPSQRLRSWGLSLVNQSTLLKKVLINTALGS